MIGYEEAVQCVVQTVPVLESEMCPVESAQGRIASENLYSRLNCPSRDVSLKDGYALRSADVCSATAANPVTLSVRGKIYAGTAGLTPLEKGTAVQINTGAGIPPGADAVIAVEFVSEFPGQAPVYIEISEPIPCGMNIHPRGGDVSTRTLLVRKLERLDPGRIGSLAAGGYAAVPVIKKPRIALIATGDEVILPGKPLPEGALYASNLMTQCAWLSQFRFPFFILHAADNEKKIQEAISNSLDSADAVCISGGAWKSDRDLTAKCLDNLGWEKGFHRVRMGPGKAAGFGMLQAKPVFILPGGPPSNEIAFLKIALPGIRKAGGESINAFKRIQVVCGETLCFSGNWTQFIFCGIHTETTPRTAVPSRKFRRFSQRIQADALLTYPEDTEAINKGDRVMVELLRPVD